ncbi:MAG: hypothetical protein QOJ11_4296 [Frankiales bacterium]|jgi:hypothetical protein|nr:hypothetical protein [Frankiales bacterium]
MTGTTTGPAARVGSTTWSDRTSGQLTGAERRELLRPLARTHVGNVVGRTAMLLGLNSGRRTELPARALRSPSSVLTRAAEQQAQQRLSPAALNHSYRCYLFGVALASLEKVDVDRELLFAAAMLHDVGLASPMAGVDFTVASARVARDVAETVGLSTAATEVMRTAITLHHTPGVTLLDGPVAYLMSAGAAMDVIGLRSWLLPPEVLSSVVAKHPRVGFKREFRTAWAAEAVAVPQGRAQLLRRYGAFDLAIRLAPFAG